MHIDMIEHAYAAPIFKGHILFYTPVVMLAEARSEYRERPAMQGCSDGPAAAAAALDTR